MARQSEPGLAGRLCGVAMLPRLAAVSPAPSLRRLAPPRTFGSAGAKKRGPLGRAG